MTGPKETDGMEELDDGIEPAAEVIVDDEGVHALTPAPQVLEDEPAPQRWEESPLERSKRLLKEAMAQPISEEDRAASEAAVQRAKQMVEIEELGNLSAEQEEASYASRMRAHRANMLRKLDRAYDNYIPFTAAEAAIKTKRKQSDMELYLRREALIRGSRISEVTPGHYIIISAFE